MLAHWVGFVLAVHVFDFDHDCFHRIVSVVGLPRQRVGSHPITDALGAFRLVIEVVTEFDPAHDCQRDRVDEHAWAKDRKAPVSTLG